MENDNSENKFLPPRAISRDFKPRSLVDEKPLVEKIEALPEAEVSGRRDFLQAVLPASGKLLTRFFGSIGTTVSNVVEETKHGARKKSD